ncbi:MAG TPA: oxidoreductase [Thermotogota bacterium]|nr:oxidoreductase [Thermotogota bacterium]HPJ87754.1 oxidoreductase [Thermotogota bacterium]HPR95248.1 oxidoreductase [Thermotogota bacterium]
MNERVALVTGASSGIGFDTAMGLKEKGFVVYGAARRMERMRDLEKRGIHILSLDVTDDESMQECVNSIVKKEGRIDILVNSAGYGSYGAIEDVPIEEARRQIEVNVLGLGRMTQLVLPVMRKNRSGRIINITSMGGKVHSPFGGWYHATKFAVEGLSDCLRMEVGEFGIEVVLIEPGVIQTDWGIIAGGNLKKTSGKGSYRKRAVKVADGMIDMYSTGKGLSPSSLVSDTIVKAATVRKPKTRYLLGANAVPLFLMKRLLSDRTYDRIVLNIMSRGK